MILPTEKTRLVVAVHPSSFGEQVSFTFLRDSKNLTIDCVGAHIGLEGGQATVREWAIRFERMAREIHKSADKMDRAAEQANESQVAKAMVL